MAGEGPLSRGSRDAPRRGGVTSAAVAAQRLGGGRAAGARPRRHPASGARLLRAPAAHQAAQGPDRSGPSASPWSASSPTPWCSNAAIIRRHCSASAARSTALRMRRSAPPSWSLPAPAVPAPVERTGTIPPAPAAPLEPGAARRRGGAEAPRPVHHAAAKIQREDVREAPRACRGHGHRRPIRAPAMLRRRMPRPRPGPRRPKPRRTRSRSSSPATPDPAKPASKPVAAVANPASKPESEASAPIPMPSPPPLRQAPAPPRSPPRLRSIRTIAPPRRRRRKVPSRPRGGRMMNAR